MIKKRKALKKYDMAHFAKGFTLCGLDVDAKKLSVSKRWVDVTCKKCLRTKPRPKKAAVAL